MPRSSTEASYRQRISWDRFARATHCVDCLPGNCPYYVFVRDGEIVATEPIGGMRSVEAALPDLNPMGCQKGAGWHLSRHGQERVLFPLKRAGERGAGQWERVSWEQALGEIADHILDAIEEVGPESVISEGTPAEGGLLAIMPLGRLAGLLGATRTDVNAVINDNSPGTYLTLGKFDPVLSIDDMYHAELVIYACANPNYTMIPSAHIASEARYRGSEVVLVAPDVSPSHMHADYHLPIRPATDAAFALGMAHVILDEELLDVAFVREQTDLPLLVRGDTGRFLRASDLEEGGREDQFYFWDERAGALAPAPLATLALGEALPALGGEHDARLRDGSIVRVRPLLEILRERLQAYAPEDAARVCGIHADNIRMMARKVASKRTTLVAGATTQKYYHGDLMLRSYLLVLALTGNWGKQGCGAGEWSTAGFDGPFTYGMKPDEGAEGAREVVRLKEMMSAALKQTDPTMTDEMAHNTFMERIAASGGGMGVPPAFLWYYHWGFGDAWRNRAWHDGAMARPFESYFDEAQREGWWQGVDQPGPERPPRVYIEVAGNALRRTRGGRKRLLETLWPQLRCIVSVDFRMSTTALAADYVLPAAHHFEKLSFQFPSPWTMTLTMGDRIVEPAGESLPEVTIAKMLAEHLQERARARELRSSCDEGGTERRLDDIAEQYTGGGKIWVDEEEVASSWVRDSAATGSLPEGTTIDTLREQGSVRFAGWGTGPGGYSQSSDIREDETHNPLRWHTEDKIPYPTLTRRAQFLIDHAWFLEADEALPRHKENPPQGGEHPFMMTSGHNRWSVHSMNITDRLLLETHRGEPHVVLNDADAAAHGIADGDLVRVWNDLGEFVVKAKVSPGVRPAQLVSYNGWEPYMYPSWDSAADLEPGMVKWLHFAGGYGHLRYRPLQWQPVPFDRGVRVSIAAAGGRDG